MKQIYQQLSCYRGLGLLATMPSNPTGNGEASSGMMGFSNAENTQETVATTSSGYAGISSAMTCYRQESQEISGPPVQQGRGLHTTSTLTPGKRHSEDSTPSIKELG